MSFREDWKAAQERDRQQPEAEEAGHRLYAKAWELHKLGVPVMAPNGWPDPALTEEALDKMLAAEKGRRATLYERFARARAVTILGALGVDGRAEIRDRLGRPFPVNLGTPIPWL